MTVAFFLVLRREVRIDGFRRNLAVFVDLLLTWIADMQKPRGEAGHMAL